MLSTHLCYRAKIFLYYLHVFISSLFEGYKVFYPTFSYYLKSFYYLNSLYYFNYFYYLSSLLPKFYFLANDLSDRAHNSEKATYNNEVPKIII